ncbi:hypothetical protein ABFA07_017842 [Porites harrisoni]
MALRRFFRISFLLVVGKILYRAEAQQCPGGRSETSILGWMLRGHIYKTMQADLPHTCVFACYKDDRCQSLNWVISLLTCEFNNRTKEARPEDFIPHADRFYFKRDKKRVPLGSIPELPAETCHEIKMSEGKATSNKYWFSTLKPRTPVLAYCNMETEDLDECTSSPPVCDFNADCTNTRGSYLCTCKAGFSGDGKTCSRWLFTTNGRKGRFGSVQTFTVPTTTRYRISAWGARGGTHSPTYGLFPGIYRGGRGAFKEGTFILNKGTVLNIVVGQRGGDSVEVKGGQSTNLTAAELGLSVEDNAGTAGGGGSFVYTTSNVLLLAAGGGGGASSGYNGTDGQSGTNGTSSVGRFSSQVRSGGTGGNPGQCNRVGGNWHGGVGAGWLGQGCNRTRSSHGERGGSRTQGWVGGRAGGMNSGYNGGPPPGAVGGFGGGGGGSEDNGASGGGGGYSGGGSGTHSNQAGGGGGSYCSGSSCSGVSGDNEDDDGQVHITEVPVTKGAD